MIRQVFGAAFVAGAIIVPLSASAQGVPEGVERGAREGDRGGGPVGAIVGGTIGGVLGGIAGFWAPMNGPVFTATSSNSAGPHTAIRATSGRRTS